MTVAKTVDKFFADFLKICTLLNLSHGGGRFKEFSSFIKIGDIIIMKIIVDFEKDGPLSQVIAHVFGTVSNAEKAGSMEEADIVITDSEDKLLMQLQRTEHKVIQFCHGQHYPMLQLVEDYPHRLRVVDVRKNSNMLEPLLQAISELDEK